MKNKKTLIIIAVLAVLVIGSLFLKTKMSGKTEVVPTPTPTVVLSKVDESVEVDLVSRSDGKAVTLTISQIPPETTSIDYELSYETGAGLPRGVLGTIHLEKGEEEVERKIDLGTCSRNVCTYDTGVETISLVLKFNSPDGSSQFQEEYEL
ncbi:hypothetical protein ISS85_04845 [Candidatus Microgenomates bacterium]|nr:hypothetical protein [Candidatus Microgenomates bacterium]